MTSEGVYVYFFPLPAMGIKIRISMSVQKTKFCGRTTSGCYLIADEPGVKVTHKKRPEIPHAGVQSMVTTKGSANHPQVINRESEVMSEVQGPARIPCQHIRLEEGDMSGDSVSGSGTDILVLR